MKSKVSLSIIFLAIVVFFINRFLNQDSVWIENYYSTTWNKYLVQRLSQFTGLVPFSIGELLVIAFFIMIPIVLIRFIFKLIKGKAFHYFKKIVMYLSLIYLLFMFLWGFNYHRVSLNTSMHFSQSSATINDLYQLNKMLIIQANDDRKNVHENTQGIMMIDGGYQSVISRASLGYQVIAKKYPIFGGRYGNPKPVKLSKLMLYTGITGVYFPFTGEANINVSVPDLLLPANTLHEMAHQRGFASEDEANFIAYLAAISHPDADFNYSGTVLALIYSMNALERYAPQMADELKSLYSDGLKRDLNYYNQFWSHYEGEVSKVSNKVNDTYLKGNGQKQGIKSYGHMVDLLLAYQKTNQ